MLSVRWIVLIVSSLLCLVVALQNMEPIDLRILFWQIVQVPKLVFLAATFVLGFVTGALVFAWPRKGSKST